MKRKGFTLVEVMITLAIFAIFSLYLYQTFFSQIRQAFGFNNNIDYQVEANKALNMITDEIRNYSYTNITFENSDGLGVTQVLSDANTSNDHLIIDLNSSTLNHDIDYNSSKEVLSLNDTSNPQNITNIAKCSNVKSIFITVGDASKNEGGLIIITVTVGGSTDITESTAINIKR